MVRVDNMQAREFFVKYPNSRIGVLGSGGLAGGIYYIDYVFEDGNALIDENGLPQIMMKTPQQYTEDTPMRDMYLGQVSYTMHTVISIISCIIIPHSMCNDIIIHKP